MSIVNSLPNSEEELRLVYDARESPNTMGSIINTYMVLVRITANKWLKTTRLPVDDLRQEGSIGLLKAIRCFDPSFGARFYTYAISCIEGQIRNAIKQNRKHTDKTISLSTLEADPQFENMLAAVQDIPGEAKDLSSVIKCLDLHTIMSRRELDFVQARYNLEI